MYLGSKNTNYFITPACVLPKAYSNSFMVLLNNRGALRQTKECISLHATTPQLPGRGTAPQAHRPIQVNIDEETFIDGEHSATTTVDYTTANSKVSFLLCRLLYLGSISQSRRWRRQSYDCVRLISPLVTATTRWRTVVVT